MLTEQEQKTLDFFSENEAEYSYRPGKIEKIDYSAIVTSRNRCPYAEEEYFKNPLIWCVDSVLRQKILPQELILLNDCSDLPPIDYTDEIAPLIEKECLEIGIKFIYHQNLKRENAANARNHAAKLANYEILHFIDDDGLLRDETSLGVVLFELIQKVDPAVFLLNLPQNTRAGFPLKIVESSQIGKINKKNLQLTANLVTCFPREYLKNAPILKLQSSQIFAPLYLDNFQGGNVLVSKSKFEKIGGFPDYHSEISYGEETGLAIKATKNNLKICYFPYTNLASVHMTYGNPSGRDQFYGNDWLKSKVDNSLNLNQMVDESKIARVGTGMRVPREYYFYIKIRNFAILLEDLEDGLGKKWAKNSNENFVIKNEVKFQDSKGSIDDGAARGRIWVEAIEDSKIGKCKSIEEIKKILNRWG